VATEGCRWGRPRGSEGVAPVGFRCTSRLSWSRHARFDSWARWADLFQHRRPRLSSADGRWSLAG
jgi:hypothetical protein